MNERVLQFRVGVLVLATLDQLEVHTTDLTELDVAGLAVGRRAGSRRAREPISYASICPTITMDRCWTRYAPS